MRNERWILLLLLVACWLVGVVTTVYAEGKEVQLQMAGGELGLEPALQDRLFEPLMHIVRNAVSHGIESPQQRAEAGKRAAGRVDRAAGGSIPAGGSG